MNLGVNFASFTSTVGIKDQARMYAIQGDKMHLYGPKQLPDSIPTARKNTILIAEYIPEEQYTYRPTADSMSVAEKFA